jgi:hypothetical protein
MAPGEAVEFGGWRSNSVAADNAPGATPDEAQDVCTGVCCCAARTAAAPSVGRLEARGMEDAASSSIKKSSGMKPWCSTIFLWKVNVFHGALYHLNDISDAVGARKLARVLRHVSRLDGVHLPGLGLHAPDSKDAAPGAHIKDHLALEVGRVAEDSGVVRVHADAVAEHLLLVVKVGVRAEVVGEVHLLVHRAHAA